MKMGQRQEFEDARARARASVQEDAGTRARQMDEMGCKGGVGRGDGGRSSRSSGDGKRGGRHGDVSEVGGEGRCDEPSSESPPVTIREGADTVASPIAPKLQRGKKE
ncbi:hypothetical protein LY78DRAFT_662672 [Colletotrichum sublineola]|nr:hypothetical protein LY78DRAFT_662672 [Colletotrichum sublineola]